MWGVFIYSFNLSLLLLDVFNKTVGIDNFLYALDNKNFYRKK